MWYNCVCFVFVFCCNGSIEGVVLSFVLRCFVVCVPLVLLLLLLLLCVCVYVCVLL